jgi:hypothetical protein
MGLFSKLFGRGGSPPAQTPPSTAVAAAPGTLYSVADGPNDGGNAGGFRIAKVLAVDDRAVHIRLYKNKYASRPAEPIDPSALTLGGITDTDGFGIGHMPITAALFRAWRPEPVRTTTPTPVTQDELDGYREWQEGGGGAFG